MMFDYNNCTTVLFLHSMSAWDYSYMHQNYWDISWMSSDGDHVLCHACSSGITGNMKVSKLCNDTGNNQQNNVINGMIQKALYSKSGGEKKIPFWLVRETGNVETKEKTCKQKLVSQVFSALLNILLGENNRNNTNCIKSIWQSFNENRNSIIRT